MNMRTIAMRRVYAWGVHVLTASGVIFGLMAILAVEARNWRAVMVWLFVALVVDGIDGPIARKINVQDALPRFDGSTLDLLVDYFTFVIVPALLLYHSALLPVSVRFVAAAAILMSALHHYCNRDIKTEDGYFVGFPAFWNIAAFYLYRFPLAPAISAAVVFVLSALTLAPIKVVHPLRVEKFRASNTIVAALWLAFAGISLAQPDLNERWLFLGNILPLIYFVWISVRRTVAGPDEVMIERGAAHARTEHGL